MVHLKSFTLESIISAKEYHERLAYEKGKGVYKYKASNGRKSNNVLMESVKENKQSMELFRVFVTTKMACPSAPINYFLKNQESCYCMPRESTME